MHATSLQILRPDEKELGMGTSEEESLKLGDELKSRKSSPGRVGRGGSIMMVRLSKAKEVEHRHVHQARELGLAYYSLNI